MDKYHLTWIGRHEGRLRDIARGVGRGDPQSICIAAGIFAQLLPDNCVLIPMPSHEGNATTMKLVCDIICKRYNKGEMWDVLRVHPHESFHEMKKRGEYPCPITMYSVSETRDLDFGGREVFILDNVIGTGTTASAALQVLPTATVFAITKG